MSKITTKANQTLFIAAMKTNRGHITKSIKIAGIESRRTYYNWLRDDKDFREQMETVRDEILDDIEAIAHSLIIDEKNVTMTIFALKTQGAKRGWQEKSEVDISEDSIKNLVKAVNEYERDY